ncbi:MAG: HD domain-containing protein [Candidatus Marinimicrobia bacterium]|jgi:3'-5' exoribonuclease|nr:HD domain-containing protein [Candidatus Neomarinimicrobiota bacterium]MDP6610937.1 HD domain-containing protein [Candidatus Neomarinimicrobiota bacterium]|tara:strand:+ start:7224 stop:8189 length:966 start_codon:yes stop_codon:yes gene_type:complete
MKSIVTISKFKEGDTIQGFYLCVEKHLRHTRAGDLYLDLTLRDRTGQVQAKVWDKVTEFNEKFSSGDPVAIKGEVDLFMERPQLTVKRINKATVQNYARYGFDPALVMPTSQANPKDMWKEIMAFIRKMKNPFLKKLCQNIYSENKEKLFTHPASVSMHHNYRSGFLEHILSMAKSALSLAPHYQLDVDLVLTGVLLHDIGKLHEIESDYEASFTEHGNLIGHIVIGRDMVRTAARKIKKFPKNLLLKVEHIILAHQGKYEWQSPKKPAFKEALLVHLIDIMDAQMNLMEMALNEDQEEGEFTNRHNYFRIPLYKGVDGTE